MDTVYDSYSFKYINIYMAGVFPKWKKNSRQKLGVWEIHFFLVGEQFSIDLDFYKTS